MTATVGPAEPGRGDGARLDGVDLHLLAQRVSTPAHVYSAAAIRQRIRALQTALQGLNAQICYAVKANANLAILQLMADAGLGADIVSGGELQRSVRAGIPADRIVFSGVAKSPDEIGDALAAGIGRFNVESKDELDTLQRLAAARNAVARASIRVNPDVDALTHAKISTGKSENKFGVSTEEARQWFADSPAVDARAVGRPARAHRLADAFPGSDPAGLATRGGFLAGTGLCRACDQQHRCRRRARCALSRRP